jgi:hypothetical protein
MNTLSSSELLPRAAKIAKLSASVQPQHQPISVPLKLFFRYSNQPREGATGALLDTAREEAEVPFWYYVISFPSLFIALLLLLYLC